MKRSCGQRRGVDAAEVNVLQRYDNVTRYNEDNSNAKYTPERYI